MHWMYWWYFACGMLVQPISRLFASIGKKADDA